MVVAYFFAQLLPLTMKRQGSLLVMGSGESSSDDLLAALLIGFCRQFIRTVRVCCWISKICRLTNI
jgi:hypothetical protein